MRCSKGIVFLLLGGALYGCGGSSDFGDLQAFMDEVDARPKGSIDPLPIFEQVEPFAYEASNMRNPFEPPVLLTKVQRRSGDPSVQPDLNRAKQFLEQYSIGNLAMVGTLARGATMFALIQDGDGSVHRIKTGDYMGTDHGRVRAIRETSVELIEIVADGTGGWVERARTVNLGGEQG